MEKIYCPICKRKVGTYDGRATINPITRCKNCNKRIIYNLETMKSEARPLPERNTSSGVTFI